VLITDALAMARQGHDVEETETVSLESIAEGCWQSVQTNDATVEIVGHFRFKSDLDRSKHLFENLFRNAIEHGGESVSVRVGPLPDDDGFYTADDGPGIPESERSHVFETGDSTGDEGTGPGRSIVAGVAAVHSRNISIDENSAGCARFEISNVVVA
jgi:signal transduction histidine kinase